VHGALSITWILFRVASSASRKSDLSLKLDSSRLGTSGSSYSEHLSMKILKSLSRKKIIFLHKIVVSSS
jgi:hypothetical protein